MTRFARFVALAAFLLVIPKAQGDAVIFNGNYVQALKDQLKLFNTARILTGTADPTAVAVDAEKGSIYMRQTPAGNGEAYVKKDNGSSVNWSLLTSTAGPVLTASRAVATDASGYLTASTATATQLAALSGLTASRATVTDGSGNLSSATTTATQIGYLSGATGTTGTSTTNLVFSTSPTLTTPNIGAASGTSLQLSGLTASKALTTDASKNLTSSTTSDTQIGYLSGTTGTTGTNKLVLDTSPSLVTPDVGAATGTSLQLSGLTASRALTTDASKNLTSSATTATELGYLSGVTTPTGSGALVLANTPTLITPVLGAATGTSLQLSGLTASKALTTDASKNLTSSATSATQLGYLSSATGTTGTTSTNLVFSTSPTLTTPVISSIVNTGTLTLPTSTDTLVGRATTDTLTNKDYDGGTASNTSRLTVPSSTFATIDGTTDKAATLAYATDIGQTFINNGSTWSRVAQGTGAVNYIYTGTSTTQGWTASGSGVTMANTFTAAELPRESTAKSGIKITPVSGTTDSVYYCFTIDAADNNKLLQLQFAARPVSGYASGDLNVNVYSYTSASCGGSETRLNLSTDVSSVSSLPNATGVYTTTFSTTSLAYYGVRFKRAAGTTAYVVSDVYLGPSITPQASYVGTWTTYTPTVSNLGAGSTTTNTGVWRRVGDSMEIRVAFKKDATPGSGASSVNWSLPTGYTINQSYLPNPSALNSVYNVIGYAGPLGFSPLTSTQSDRLLPVIPFTTTSFVIEKPLTNGGEITGADIPASTYVSATVLVPISEFAGSGTMNLSSNTCEYVYNSSTSTTSDTTSFAYGPDGAFIQSYAPTGLNTVEKRVRFQTPIQPTDSLSLEVNNTINWAPMVDQLGPYVTNDAATTAYGQLIRPVSGTATDVSVLFASQTGGKSAWSGLSGTWKWRAKKCSGGQPVGFSTADTTSSGLMSTTTQTLAGAKTWNDNQTFKINSGATTVGSYDTSGAWTIGAASNTKEQTINGKYLTVKTAGLSNGSQAAFYVLSPAANQSCTTTCGTEPTGLNANSGTCLAAWSSGGVSQTCATAAAGNFCLCVGIP